MKSSSSSSSGKKEITKQESKRIEVSSSESGSSSEEETEEERKKREEKERKRKEDKEKRREERKKKEKESKEGESSSPKSPKKDRKKDDETSSPKSPSKSRKLKESKEETVPSSPKDRIVKSGWLEKKGVVRHNWTRRWMVLEKKNEIRYYKNTFDSEPKGSISLTNASVYSHVEKKGKEMPGYFNIRVGNRDYLLRAENGEVKAEWVKAIKANVVVPKEEEDNTTKKNPSLTKTPSFLGVVKQ